MVQNRKGAQINIYDCDPQEKENDIVYQTIKNLEVCRGTRISDLYITRNSSGRYEVLKDFGNNRSVQKNFDSYENCYECVNAELTIQQIQARQEQERKEEEGHA